MSESTELLKKLVTESAHGRHTVKSIADDILSTHPEVVDDWYAEEKGLAFHLWVSDQLRLIRRAARTISSDTVAERLASGESTPSVFNVSEVINDENERKPLSEMVREDLLYVADRYKERASTNSLYAGIYRMMAKKIGSATITVGEKWSEAHVAAMYRGEAA